MCCKWFPLTLRHAGHLVYKLLKLFLKFLFRNGWHHGPAFFKFVISVFIWSLNNLGCKKKLTVDWLRHCTCFTDQIIKLYCHNKNWNFCIIVNLCGSNQENLWLHKHVTLIHWFPEITFVKGFVEMLLNTLPFDLMFLLTEHVFPAITSSWTRNLLFEICSSISIEWNPIKTLLEKFNKVNF